MDLIYKSFKHKDSNRSFKAPVVYVTILMNDLNCDILFITNTFEKSIQLINDHILTNDKTKQISWIDLNNFSIQINEQYLNTATRNNTRNVLSMISVEKVIEATVNLELKHLVSGKVKECLVN